jgi:hypothetical protein
MTYKKGVEPIRDKEYERLRKESFLFGSRQTMFNLNEKSGLQSALNIIKGDEEGRYFSASERKSYPAQRTELKAEIAACEKEFERFQTQRVNAGYRRTETWPQLLRERKLKLEAALIVCEEEISELKKRILSFVEKVEAEEDRNILKYGPRGSGRLRNGKLCEVDGQRVVEINGRLIIDIGPFDGLEVSCYMDVVDAWKAELRRQDAEKLALLQAEAKRFGKDIPKALPFKSLKTVNVNSLPGWPVDRETGLAARNWKKHVVEESSGMKRTKHQMSDRKNKMVFEV